LIEIGCMQARFRNLQNYAEKAVKFCSKFANYAEKKWLCSVDFCCHGKGSISRVLDPNGQNLDLCIRNPQLNFQGDPMVYESEQRGCY